MNLNNLNDAEYQRVVGNLGRAASHRAFKAFRGQGRPIDSLTMVEISDEVRDHVWDLCRERNLDFDVIGMDATSEGEGYLA